jgi:NarL family two-component system response regulator LiaR
VESKNAAVKVIWAGGFMGNLQPIRVMLVDDHLMVRLGLTMILQLIDGMVVVGEAASGESAIELCGKLMPDVVLMDMLLPSGMNGAAAIRAIHQQYPTVRSIALTSIESGELIQEALEAGAVGYLLKNVTAQELEVAVRAVAAGMDALSPAVLKMLIRNVTRQSSSKDSLLTTREKEVLTLMVEGFGNAEIAKRLIVGASTIKSHVSSILSKLNVTNRTEAVTLALRHNLLP